MRKYIYILIVLIIAVVIGYNYIYQDHRTIENENAAYVMTSTKIGQEFSKNPSSSEQKYLNKTIAISGTITEKNTKDITLDDTVFCQFLNDINPAITNNSPLKIKGRVIGYDDLLEQVKLDQCVIIND